MGLSYPPQMYGYNNNQSYCATTLALAKINCMQSVAFHSAMVRHSLITTEIKFPSRRN
uniref:Uncharacterized protein n=1 Tax=Anguilla anguilla TaxID=7936 RepID=A0A0E9WGK2_ANGAN